ncbi:MAG: RlpA-like double-psi beta-barrel domain-containing protein [Fibrobacter sp.]|nr:RlpA-like double-psi beta-barrel domain-containing protein [Fibrobacter sp.]
MRKKFFSAFCVLAAASLSFVGCGSDSPAAAPESSAGSQVSSSASQVSSSATASSNSAKSSSSSVVAASSSSVENEIVSSGSVGSASATDAWYFDDADGACEKCDSYTAQDPVLNERGGTGSITTYGSITEKETSLGGACNYGQTNIQYYAAIHVNVSSGDDKGPWNGGLACGGCVRVKAKTPDGWKRVTVRITDRCPDESCGVDLGGAPASDIMGITVGRYYGEWEFVSCEGVEGVWGDSTSIWVKEGASAYWSVVQVRNPKDAVKSISINGQELKIFSGAENFWEVPQEILQSDSDVKITVEYRSGTPDVWMIPSESLTVGEGNYYLHEYRE